MLKSYTVQVLLYKKSNPEEWDHGPCFKIKGVTEPVASQIAKNKMDKLIHAREIRPENGWGYVMTEDTKWESKKYGAVCSKRKA